MLALRTEKGMSVAKFNSLFNADFDKEYKTVLSQKMRFMERNGDMLKIKDEYLYVQNDIILAFLK